MGAQKNSLNERVLLSTHNLVLMASASNEGSLVRAFVAHLHKVLIGSR